MALPKQAIDATGRVWDRESIIGLLLTSDKAVERALLTLYARQTSTEQQIGDTRERNGVGFAGFDGEIFSSFAQQILKSSRPPGSRLSPKQIACARKPVGKAKTPRIGCYAGQLLSAIQPPIVERLAA